MAALNPNPYIDGDPLGPTGRITAIFDSQSELVNVIQELDRSGYRGKDAAVFVGPEAVEQFDAQGKNRGIEGVKVFQNAVCDELDLFDQFEAALKTGGAVVAIRTGDDEEKKKTVVDLLKAHNARKINYWGKWHFDGLG